ncbi:hypothetical protein [Aquabacter cavernae]|uniref:hypothetical protein n=1 Tax=Aquabacter cavernae TaxID=2496029 RepID=UPI000F8D8BE6|nr:hypothetical protein [Aquabacter cavernae]
MSKGLSISFQPLDADHVRARINWREQDVGGGSLVIELIVRNRASAPKSEAELEADTRALAVRFARAFADTLDE